MTIKVSIVQDVEDDEVVRALIGPAGRSIQSIVINEDAEITITLSDTTVYTFDTLGPFMVKAREWASNPENVEVETGLYSALHYAIKASDDAGVATTKASEALTSANTASTAEAAIVLLEAATQLASQNAEKWADEDEDVEVDTGQYSAKHHALKAASKATDTAADVITTNAARDAALDAQTDAEAAKDLSVSSKDTAVSAAATATSGAATATTKASEASSSASDALSHKNDAESAATTATVKAAEAVISANAAESDAVSTAADRVAVATDRVLAEAAEVEAEGHADRAALEAADALSAVAYQDLTAINNTYNQTGVVALFSYNAFNDADFGAWRLKWPHLSYKREARPTGPWLGYLANEAAARAADGAGTGSYYHNSTDGKFYQLSDGSGQVEIIRGAGRDMPSQVDIVCEADRVVLWDRLTGEMWRVEPYTGLTVTDVKGLNGKLYIATTTGLIVSDYATGDLGTVTHDYTTSTTPAIVNNAVNAIAATTLANAPINTVTGLPYDTVAAGTDGGVSIIDGPAGVGTVVDITHVLSSVCKFIAFRQDGALVYTVDASVSLNRFIHVLHDLPAADLAQFQYYSKGSSDEFYHSATPSAAFIGTDIQLAASSAIALKSISGNLVGHSVQLSAIFPNRADPSLGSFLVATDTYATGVMPSGIKFAGLCDTDDTDLVATDIIEDRSHNGDDITLSDTATRIKVATGADLVWTEFASDETVTLDTDISSTGMVEWWEDVAGVATFYAKDLSGGTSYVNGVSGTPPADSITFSGADMTLKAGKPMALARPASTIKSAEQVAATYAIERHWFEPDAVVTLDNAVVQQVAKSDNEIHVLTDGGHNIFDADTYVRTSFEAGDFNHISVTDGVVLKD